MFSITSFHLLAYFIVVCCVNLIKLVCMIYSVKILSNEEPTTKPLSTIGDAIAVFLAKGDNTTKMFCLTNKVDLMQEKVLWSSERTHIWSPTQIRWFHVVSRKRLGWNFGL